MRATLLLVGGVGLLVGACSDKGGKGGPAPTPPPPLNKQLLAGEWKSVSEVLFIAGFEFGEDGTMKMIVRGMDKPVPGRYTWSGERTLSLQYQAADVRKAYQEAARAYRDQVKKNVEARKLYERAAPSLMAAARDELPTEEKFQVSIAEQPRLLILINQDGSSLQFE
jgi:hypothetical protein